MNSAEGAHAHELGWERLLAVDSTVREAAWGAVLGDPELL